MGRTQLYERLRDAVEARGDDSDAVEALRTRTVRSLIGPEAIGMTTTLIRNTKRRLAAELRREEMQAVADGILSGIQRDFPDAEAKLLRGRRIEVWLDPPRRTGEEVE